MNDLKAKCNFLLSLKNIRERITNYKYVHVFNNDKFVSGIIKFIISNFNTDEHCFVISGGVSENIIPIPDFPNVFTFPNALFIHNSPNINKFIFHGMYVPGIADMLYKKNDILSKSYWLPWGRDVYEGFKDDAKMIYVKSHMAAVAANAHVRASFLQQYGSQTDSLPYDISYESIPYDLIISTNPPQQNYTQILVNNCTHETTFEVFDYLKKFRDENIRIAAIFSYGDYPDSAEILKRGKNFFGSKFMAVEKFLPPAQYIKFLARNDILILNQRRPQGMTTLFTMMLLGKKVFMRSNLSDYLRQDGYCVHDTQKIPELTFAELIAPEERVEENRNLASQRFDREHVKNFWNRIFTHTPEMRHQVN